VEIVAADPKASVLSEAEVRGLLAEPLLMRLGMVDADGWPLVHPVWHVFEGERFRVAVARRSHKATVLRASRRAYFTVDTDAEGESRGVRGRADVQVVDGHADLAVEISRKTLLKYTGTDQDAYARQMLGWAAAGDMSIVELSPRRFAAFSY
jgi:nitroimidazol reductase NimA-like FMN-containing flavoprotein (pyridoxamine 5'-phosphate oxidase superfamily)